MRTLLTLIALAALAGAQASPAPKCPTTLEGYLLRLAIDTSAEAARSYGIWIGPAPVPVAVTVDGGDEDALALAATQELSQSFPGQFRAAPSAFLNIRVTASGLATLPDGNVGQLLHADLVYYLPAKLAMLTASNPYDELISSAPAINPVILLDSRQKADFDVPQAQLTGDFQAMIFGLLSGFVKQIPASPPLLSTERPPIYFRPEFGALGQPGVFKKWRVLRPKQGADPCFPARIPTAAVPAAPAASSPHTPAD